MKALRREACWLGRIVILSLLVNLFIESASRKSIFAAMSYLAMHPVIFMLNGLIILLPYMLVFLTRRRYFVLAAVSVKVFERIADAELVHGISALCLCHNVDALKLAGLIMAWVVDVIWFKYLCRLSIHYPFLLILSTRALIASSSASCPSFFASSASITSKSMLSCTTR